MIIPPKDGEKEVKLLADGYSNSDSDTFAAEAVTQDVGMK